MFTKVNLIIAAAAQDAGVDAAGSTIPILGPIIKEFHITWPRLVAQMFNFLSVAYILYRFAFKPILSRLEQRPKEIGHGLQSA